MQGRLQKALFTGDDFRAISTAATAKQRRCSKVVKDNQIAKVKP